MITNDTVGHAAGNSLDREAARRVMGEAKEVLMTIGTGDHRMSDVLARLIVMAIKAGAIPHVAITS